MKHSKKQLWSVQVYHPNDGIIGNHKTVNVTAHNAARAEAKALRLCRNGEAGEIFGRDDLARRKFVVSKVVYEGEVYL